MKHFIIIRSAYSDKCDTDKRAKRLEFTDRICASSLQGQTVKDFTVLLRVNNRDLLYNNLIQIFSDRNIDFRLLHCTNINQYDKSSLTDMIKAECKPNDKLIISRMDDDDAIGVNYMRDLQNRVSKTEGTKLPIVWSFPEGFHTFHGKLCRFHRPANMFVSVQCDFENVVDIFSVSHSAIDKIAPIRHVNKSPSWIWFRHTFALSYGNVRKHGPIYDDLPVDDFSIDWDLLLSK